MYGKKRRTAPLQSLGVVFSVISLCLVNLFGGIIQPNAIYNNFLKDGDYQDNLFPLHSYATHAPIVINGDSQFLFANGVSSGNGSQSNPFIIEGWNISASIAHGISIQNTNAFFVIRDSIIHSGGSSYDGIYLLSSNNGRIDNCTIFSCNDGIYLYTSSWNNISRCAIYENIDNGILIRASSDNIIINNTIFNNLNPSYGGGITFYGSTSNLRNKIYYNLIYNHNTNGIVGWTGTDQTQVVNNTLYSNAIGIYLGWSNDWIIENNTIYNYSESGAGIYLDNGASNTIRSNDLSFGHCGIFIWSSTSNTIENNTIRNSELGIEWNIWNSRPTAEHDNHIRYNIIENGGFGIYFHDNRAYDNYIYENDFINNTIHAQAIDTDNYFDYNGKGNYWDNYTGVDNDFDGIGDSPYSISNGLIYDNYPLIIPVLSPRTRHITHSPISINGDSQFLPSNGVSSGNGSQSNPYIIEWWNISASTTHGISIQNTNAYFIIRDSIIHSGANSYSGIYLSSSNNGRIEDCNISSCLDGIYLSTSSSDNIIINNRILKNNNDGISHDQSSNLRTKIYNNIIYENGRYAIFGRQGSDQVQVINNTLDNNNLENYAIYLGWTNGWIVENNTVYNCINGYAIMLDNGASNTIRLNHLLNGIVGVYIYASGSNTIENNTILNCTYGVFLNVWASRPTATNSNHIRYNIIKNGVYGVIIGDDRAFDNYIYENDFINNTIHAQAIDTDNYFDYNGRGNYWDNYTGRDSDSNGIGDSPYSISNGLTYDNYPLINPVYNFKIIHDPIVINGNGDFLPQNGVVGGNGSKENPFLINNLEINAHYNSTGINITDTNLYLIIRNIIIRNSGNDPNAGIKLDNSSYVEINNCSLFNIHYGFRLLDSDNNSIHDNYILNATGSQIDYSNLNNFTCNTFIENLYGIYFYYSDENQIIGNKIYNGSNYGIAFSRAHNNLIYGNYIWNKSWGILFQDQGVTSLNTAEANTVLNCTIDGIKSDWSGQNTIIENIIANCSEYGIRLSNTGGHVLYHNYLTNNTLGQARDDNTVNTWHNGSTGNVWGDYIEKYPGASNNGLIWNISYLIDGPQGATDPYPLVSYDIINDITNPQIIDLDANFDLEQGNQSLFSWRILDYNPANYTVHCNGTLVDFGGYENNIELSYMVTNYTLGLYVFEIFANDMSGRSSSAQINVTVKPRADEYIFLEPNVPNIITMPSQGLWMNFTGSDIAFINVTRQTLKYLAITNNPWSNLSIYYFYSFSIYNSSFGIDESMIENITIRFYYSSATIKNPNDLHILHYVFGNWVLAADDTTLNITGGYIEFTTTELSFFCLGEIKLGEGAGDDPGDDNDKPPDNIVIIIIIIIIIGSVAGFSGIAYSKTKKGNPPKSRDSKSELVKKPLSSIKKQILEKESPSTTNELKPLKKKKMQPIALPVETGPSDEEKAELARTESEVDVQENKIICIVHRGKIVGDIYVCPNCQTFYCQRCAKVLKSKEEKCWSCNDEITVALTESEKKSLLTLRSADLLKQIIESDPILSKVFKEDKTIKEVPELYDYDLLLLNPDELNKIDKMDLTIQQKAEIINEYILLEMDDRKEIFDQSEPEEPELTSAFELSPEFQEIYQTIESQLSSTNTQIKDLENKNKAGEISEDEYIKRNVFLSEKRRELKEQRDQLFKQKEIISLESEIEELKKKIEEHNRTFIAGAISQEDYLREKNIMAEKLGTLIGKKDLLVE